MSAATKQDKSTKQGKGSTDRSRERQYTFTDDALKIIDDAPKKGLSPGKFVSNCVVAYGKYNLAGQYPNSDMPTLDIRIAYLEKIVVMNAFQSIQKNLDDNNSLDVHTDILKQFPSLRWYDNLDVLRDTAKKDDRTKYTKKYEWQTLLRQNELKQQKK